VRIYELRYFFSVLFCIRLSFHSPLGEEWGNKKPTKRYKWLYNTIPGDSDLKSCKGMYLGGNFQTVDLSCFHTSRLFFPRKCTQPSCCCCSPPCSKSTLATLYSIVGVCSLFPPLITLFVFPHPPRTLVACWLHRVLFILWGKSNNIPYC
jgi:hypothetical protein